MRKARNASITFVIVNDLDQVCVVHHIDHAGVAMAVAELVALLGEGPRDRLVDVLLGEADQSTRRQGRIGRRLAPLLCRTEDFHRKSFLNRSLSMRIYITVIEPYIGGELGELHQGRCVLHDVPLLVDVEAEVVRVGVVVAG